MKAVKTVIYEDIIKSGNDSSIRLPMLQSGNYISLLPLIKSDSRFSGSIDKIKELADIPVVPFVFSANIVNTRSVTDYEVYVEVYTNTTEIVKTVLADILTKSRKLKGAMLEYVVGTNRLFNFLREVGVSTASLNSYCRQICSAIEELNANKQFSNILEVIDFTESTELKSVTYELVTLLNPYSELAYSLVGSVDEIYDAINDNKNFFRLFIKQIQIKVNSTSDYGCVGVCDCSSIILPAFNLAGVTSDIYNTEYYLFRDCLDIIHSLADTDITDYYSYALRLSCYTATYDNIFIDNINALVSHELTKEIINSHRPCSEDVYSYTIHKIVK